MLLFWPRKFPEQNLFVVVIDGYSDKPEKYLYSKRFLPPSVNMPCIFRVYTIWMQDWIYFQPTNVQFYPWSFAIVVWFLIVLGLMSHVLIKERTPWSSQVHSGRFQLEHFKKNYQTLPYQRLGFCFATTSGTLHTLLWTIKRILKYFVLCFTFSLWFLVGFVTSTLFILKKCIHHQEINSIHLWLNLLIKLLISIPERI